MSISEFKSVYLHSLLQNFRAAETGRIIFYTTSMRIVRDTYERCVRVKTILQTHMVQYEERDVFMSRENQLELKERLKAEVLDVPQVFADGVHLGVSDVHHVYLESMC